ncbi:MAG TPA: carbonic anhydrase [Bdellovibrio sp.]
MFRVLMMGLMVLSMTACSSMLRRNRTPTQDETKIVLKDAQGAKKEAPAQASSTEEKEMTAVSVDAAGKEENAEAIEMKKAVAAAAEHIQQNHTSETKASTRMVGSVPADKAFGWLKNGNTRFTKGRLRADGASAKDRMRLAQGQRPHSIILSCSDSRVPPELVFDQKLGEIFVVRTAGESLDDNVIGSIEYAVEHLGANLLVVMGHESCGAIKAAIASLKGGSLGSPGLDGLVADIKPRVQQYANTTPTAGVIEESWSNVDGVSKDLLERSAILRDAVASGEVKVVKAMYHFETGKVDWR